MPAPRWKSEDAKSAVLSEFARTGCDRTTARNLGGPLKAIRHVLREAGVCPSPRVLKGPDNPSWKGGRTKDPDGYVLVRRKDHPAANSLGYVREHRLVMEKYLGRHLRPGEVVHHKNGVRDDNRLSNLRLFASNADHLRSELSGRRPRHTPEGRARIVAAVTARHARERIRRASEAGVQKSP